MFCHEPVLYGMPAVWVRADDADGLERYAHQSCTEKSARDADSMTEGFTQQ